MLLPVLALAVAGAAVALTVALRTDGGLPTAAVASPEASATPLREAARPKLKPGQTVCQGVLHVPEKDQPRTFADVYTHIEDAQGIAVVGGGAVPQEAFDVARRTVRRMLANSELLAPLVEQGAYVIIVDRGKGVLDLPEFACLEGQLGLAFFDHVCGIADRADYPVVTVNTSDLLGERSGPCGGLNILYHELGHLVQGWAIAPADYFDVKQYYQDAISAGKYRKLYASTNPNEYFAEGTQAYFDDADLERTRDRAWLRTYDPQLYALLERVYGGR